MALHRDDVLKLVDKYKATLARGHNGATASGLVVMAAMETLCPVEACRLLAAAVALLAEADGAKQTQPCGWFCAEGSAVIFCPVHGDPNQGGE